MLSVKVVPGSSRKRIVGEFGDGIKLSVTAPPEDGAANRAVIELLAETLELPRGNIRIVRGLSKPRKEILISGLSPEEISARLGRPTP